MTGANLVGNSMASAATIRVVMIHDDTQHCHGYVREREHEHGHEREHEREHARERVMTHMCTWHCMS